MQTPVLTPEQEAALKQKWQAEEKAAKENRARELEAYNQIKDETIRRVFSRLQSLNTDMEIAKKELLAEFDSLVETKNELYKVDEKQMSHSWTSADGAVTIITGFNSIDRWDETASVGITKVNAWLDKQMSNDVSSALVAIIRELLKPNKEGMLKANRVLDLQNHADKIGDPDLIEAVKIIREAHRPDRTGNYIKCKYKDEKGDSQWLALSMSAI